MKKQPQYRVPRSLIPVAACFLLVAWLGGLYIEGRIGYPLKTVLSALIVFTIGFVCAVISAYIYPKKRVPFDSIFDDLVQIWQNPRSRRRFALTFVWGSLSILPLYLGLKLFFGSMNITWLALAIPAGVLLVVSLFRLFRIRPESDDSVQ